LANIKESSLKLLSKFHRGPSIDASYQVWVHLAKRFQRRFLEIGQSEKELPVAAMFANGLGRNEHLYRGPSIDASYLVSVFVKIDLIYKKKMTKKDKITNSEEN
jgi:hypothetical protein